MVCITIEWKFASLKLWIFKDYFCVWLKFRSPYFAHFSNVHIMILQYSQYYLHIKAYNNESSECSYFVWLYLNCYFYTIIPINFTKTYDCWEEQSNRGKWILKGWLLDSQMNEVVAFMSLLGWFSTRSLRVLDTSKALILLHFNFSYHDTELCF